MQFPQLHQYVQYMRFHYKLSNKLLLFRSKATLVTSIVLSE